MTGVRTVNPPVDRDAARALIDQIDVAAARDAVAGKVRHTPAVASPELSERLGSPVVLKAECLQETGSFKLRGALNRVAALGEDADAGLITASAGNHARAVARAARLRGVGCEVFMPRDAAVSKVLAVRGLGADVQLGGESVDEVVELARERSAQTGAAFVHPFDDLDVIAGQGTLGLELLADVPDLARVVVPVGGGGLAGGIGVALAGSGREVELICVQAASCAPFVEALAGREAKPASATTIADGIAVKRPGELTLPLLRELAAGALTVTEDQIAGAMVLLAETAKLVAEGAGAASVAALLHGGLPPVEGATVAVLSGGNVDSGLLAALLLRHETEEGRRVRIFTRIPDRPGGLAELLTLVAGTRANVLSVEHHREAVPLGVRETAVELTLETRGPDHTRDMLDALAAGGYQADLG